MAQAWKVADSLDVLLGQLDDLAPERSKASDGSIGDAAHASRSSDHNPWWRFLGQAYVTARDFTHDPDHGLDCHALATALEQGHDPRTKYAIFNERIMSGAGGPAPWQWRPYTGTNPHTHHLHLSVVSDARALSKIPWLLPGMSMPPSRLVGLLRRGSTGAAVVALQHVLNAWYPHDVALTVDGAFGPATEAAVRLAQQRAGLAVDGVVGPATRALLNLDQ